MAYILIKDGVKEQIDESDIEELLEEYFEDSEEFAESVKQFADSEGMGIFEAEEVIQSEFEDKINQELEENGHAKFGDVEIICE